MFVAMLFHNSNLFFYWLESWNLLWPTYLLEQFNLIKKNLGANILSKASDGAQQWMCQIWALKKIQHKHYWALFEDEAEYPSKNFFWSGYYLGYYLFTSASSIS